MKFDLSTQTHICAICPNMCRFLCPVAAVEKAETVTPRGKATITLAVERGEIAWDAEAASVLYHCAGCKMCREWCPSNVDIPEFTAHLRERAGRDGLIPDPAPGVRDRLMRDRSFRRPAAELAAGLDRYRDLLSPEATVLYFAGCSTATLFPDVIGATLRLFEAAGVKVTMLRPEECCGFPLEALGYREEAADFAAALAESISKGGYETIVSGCPMCTHVMKERYAALGVELRAEVVHVTEFLDRLAGAGNLRGGQGARPGDGTVTYHDPCYLGRHQGVYDEPRRLLTGLGRFNLVEVDPGRELAACCGGAPSIDAVLPRTATGIGVRRLADAARTGAGTLVTACPHCLEMLGSAGDDGGRPVVRDIAEVLARRLGLWPSGGGGRG
ncbi:MAG: (Fe-S)-binding protein [Bacillota bacterium]|nr:MAG: (Fe-S)-binding protein [Bacillota bacterium]